MTEKHAASFGIVLYKNKLLLLLRDDNPQLERPNVWSFIGGNHKTGESPEETYKREVEDSTGIIIPDTKLLVVLERENGKHYGYFNRLTDRDVNDMKPGSDRQKLGFFTLDDMYRIQLSETPTLFLSEHRSLFQGLTI